MASSKLHCIAALCVKFVFVSVCVPIINIHYVFEIVIASYMCVC